MTTSEDGRHRTYRPIRFSISFDPDWAVHPGETLAELLEETGWSQAELARQSGLSTKHINLIVRGKASIGVQAALQLERATHVRAELWVTMQARYDVKRARDP